METKNKGITLIALIITIIVLLILAGVTIATLTGNHGILSQVDEAKVSTIKSKVEEEIGLAVQSANLKIRTKTATNNSWNAVTEGILPTTAIAKTKTKDITSEATNGTVLVTLLADLQKEGYYVAVEAVQGEGTGATRKITITYEGSDYRKAKKNTNAIISKTLDVTQSKIIYGDCNHIWEDGEVTTAATCGTAGVKTRTCTVCHQTQTEAIPATGNHTYVSGICSVCGARDLVIGAKIDYKEYISPSGSAFTTMPEYTTVNLGNSYNKKYTVKAPAEEETGIEWIVLGKENGQIKITTKDYVKPTEGTTLTLYGKEGYANFVNELNKIGAIYGKGKYADTSKFPGKTGGRSFKMEDLGYTYSREGTAYTYKKDNSDGKIYRYVASDPVDESTKTGGSYSDFWYTDADAIKNTEEPAENKGNSLSTGESKTIYPYTYSASSSTLSTDIAKTESGTKYWLASRNLSFDSGCVYFLARDVGSSGSYGYGCYLYASNGSSNNRDYLCGVRPVVYLKSDIQLSDYDSTNGYSIVEPGT